MSITNLPPFFDMVYTQDDGKLSRDGYLYNDQMFQTLNVIVILLNAIVTSSITGANVTIDGINPPSKTTAQINALEPNVPVGTIWYNSTLEKLQFKASSGVIETITST